MNMRIIDSATALFRQITRSQGKRPAVAGSKPPGAGAGAVADSRAVLDTQWAALGLQDIPVGQAHPGAQVRELGALRDPWL